MGRFGCLFLLISMVGNISAQNSRGMELKKYIESLESGNRVFDEYIINPSATEKIKTYYDGVKLDHFSVQIYEERRTTVRYYYIISDTLIYITSSMHYYSFGEDKIGRREEQLHLIDGEEVYRVDRFFETFTPVYPLEIITLYDLYKSKIEG